MKRAIQDHLGDFAAISALIIIGIATLGYIYSQQTTRSKIPLLEEPEKKLSVEFSDAQAVVAGQGQSVRVAGVEIGLIRGVHLEDGKAVVDATVDARFSQVIHKDATALLRPQTGLKDMFLEIDPGSPRAPVMADEGRITVENTTPDVDPDEILAALDTDTRAYLEVLINGGADGLRSHGDDLREVFHRFEPLHRDLARITSAIAERRRNLRTLVSNYQSLTNELGDKDREIVRLISQGNQVLDAFANEDDNVSATVAGLEPALRQTTETLRKVDRFSPILASSLESLRPAVRRLDEANKRVIPFALEAEPIVREKLRPFVREARPFVRDLQPAADDLSDATPEMTVVLGELNRFFNMAAYNENGAESLDNPDNPTKSDLNRKESYLHWVLWTASNGNSLFSQSSGSGVLRRLALAVSCDTLQQAPQLVFGGNPSPPQLAAIVRVLGTVLAQACGGVVPSPFGTLSQDGSTNSLSELGVDSPDDLEKLDLEDVEDLDDLTKQIQEQGSADSDGSDDSGGDGE